jgi:hypothetical protein
MKSANSPNGETNFIELKQFFLEKIKSHQKKTFFE